MKYFTFILGAVALAGLGAGCGKAGSAASSSADPETLARYHFVGTRELANHPNAAKIREIWELPETRRLAEQTLTKLAHAPQTFHRQRISAAQDERGAALLRPLLDDLLREESVLQIRGPADATAEWTLGVHLPPERLKAWSTGVSELTQLWQLGTAAQKTLEGAAAWEIRRNDAPSVVFWAEAGGWFVLGVGQGNSSLEALRKIKTTGRPVAAASNYWLEASADLPRLQRAVELEPVIRWPAITLSLTGAGENLRTTMRLSFTEPMTGPLPPWRVPTNIIRDPLISFTAMRGVGPLLSTSPTVSKLRLNPVPNELFLWGQDRSAYQSFLAWPATDITNTLKRIADTAPSLVSPEMHKRGLGQIVWLPTNVQVFWQALPAITPFLNRSEDGGREYITGGLFPPARSTNPPPADLLAQFTGRTNLLCYDWEITQTRLAQWHMMSQLFAIIADKPQLVTNTAGLPWLMKVGTHLGNTATEVTAQSAKEWTLRRTSHIGFTGVELVQLVRWLESTNFPRLSIDLVRQPRMRQGTTTAPSPP